MTVCFAADYSAEQTRTAVRFELQPRVVNSEGTQVTYFG